MPTIIFSSASPALGTDVFIAEEIKKYARGSVGRKVNWIGILGGTVGTGKFDLKYGGKIIAQNLQATTNDVGWNMPDDYQKISDSRWCKASETMVLEVTEAPAATLKFLVGFTESGGFK